MFQYFKLIGPSERVFSLEHKEKKKTYGVNVCFGTVLILLKYFWSLKGEDSNYLLPLHSHDGIFHVDDLAKVGDLDF